jgi:hypothetical protein
MILLVSFQFFANEILSSSPSKGVKDISLTHPELSRTLEAYYQDLINSSINDEVKDTSIMVCLKYHNENLEFSNEPNNNIVRIDTVFIIMILKAYIGLSEDLFMWQKQFHLTRKTVQFTLKFDGAYIEGYKWFADHGMPVGRYDMENTDSHLNQFMNSSLSIKGVHFPGPSNAVLSMVVPGLGIHRVSKNKLKTGLAIGMVALPVLVAGVTEFTSQNFYKRYFNSTDNEEMSVYFQRATNWHRSSLIASGVSILTHVFQISWTLKVGMQNSIEEKIAGQIAKQKKWVIYHD